MDIDYREDADIEDRTIDSHIKRIRKKFKKVDPDFSAIETRYGQIGVNMITDWLYYPFDIDIFININEFVAGVVTIGLIFGAYMGETFRGAFMAVDHGQIEAGKAYGMSNSLVFRRIRW